jgi:hypothetical protein
MRPHWLWRTSSSSCGSCPTVWNVGYRMPECLNLFAVAASVAPGSPAYCEIDAYPMKYFPLLLNRKLIRMLSSHNMYLAGGLQYRLIVSNVILLSLSHKKNHSFLSGDIKSFTIWHLYLLLQERFPVVQVIFPTFLNPVLPCFHR